MDTEPTGSQRGVQEPGLVALQNMQQRGGAAQSYSNTERARVQHVFCHSLFQMCRPALSAFHAKPLCHISTHNGKLSLRVHHCISKCLHLVCQYSLGWCCFSLQIDGPNHMHANCELILSLRCRLNDMKWDQAKLDEIKLDEKRYQDMKWEESDLWQVSGQNKGWIHPFLRVFRCE